MYIIEIWPKWISSFLNYIYLERFDQHNSMIFIQVPLPKKGIPIMVSLKIKPIQTFNDSKPSSKFERKNPTKNESAIQATSIILSLPPKKGVPHYRFLWKSNPSKLLIIVNLQPNWRKSDKKWEHHPGDNIVMTEGQTEGHTDQSKT